MKIEKFISEAKKNKCRPAIYIENTFLNIKKYKNYFRELLKECNKNNFIIIDNINKEEIYNKYKKLYLAKYGFMGTYLEALITRKGSKIISGCLDL